MSEDAVKPLLRRGPGHYADIDAAAYHKDPAAEPSLSSSLAKTIMERTLLHAWAAHPRLNKDFAEKHDDKFDLGSVAHELILGKGGGIVVLPYSGYQTNAAKEARDEARASGKTPILAEQMHRASKMCESVCDALAQTPGAVHLFKDPARDGNFTNGIGESVLIWKDIGGPLCRAMIDWLIVKDGAMEVFDIKTTDVPLSDGSIERQIGNMHFDLSAAFYLRGLLSHFPECAGRIKFRWIFVEASAPHEVRVVEPSAHLLTIGDRKAALAIAKWKRAIETNVFPGYDRRITTVDLAWRAEERQMEREMKDDDAIHMVTSNSTPMASEPSGRLSEIAS